jgi:hypothetical protein
LHQVIGYNVELNGNQSLSEAETAIIEIYDPNEPAEYYTNESRQLEIDVSQATVSPIINNDGTGYQYLYHRLSLVGPSRPDFTESLPFQRRIIIDFLSNYLDGFINIYANSPVRVEATAPNGTALEHPDGPVDGIPPEEIVYLTGAPAGEYEIEVIGEEDGEYGLNIQGAVPDSGQIDESITDEISEGETQTFTARIPADEQEGEGDIEEGSPMPSLGDYANEDGVVNTDGLRDAVADWRSGEIDADLLRKVVNAWRSGEPIE